MSTQAAYQIAKEQYAKIGVDTDAVLERLKQIKVSIHCWQGDDIAGFLFQDNALTGGIQVTGNYPGRACTVAQLRQDFEKALSCIPGTHKFNLHAIYADTNEKVDLNELEPRHFASWVDWAWILIRPVSHTPWLTADLPSPAQMMLFASSGSSTANAVGRSAIILAGN